MIRCSIFTGSSRTRRMANSSRDSRGYSGKADLTDSACAEFVDLLIRIIEEVYVYGRCIWVHCHEVISQFAIDGCAPFGVIRGVLKQGHPNAHHHRSTSLICLGSYLPQS